MFQKERSHLQIATNNRSVASSTSTSGIAMTAMPVLQSGGQPVQCMVIYPSGMGAIDTRDIDKFKSTANRCRIANPDGIYEMHMALLNGIGSDPKLRRQHQPHLEYLHTLMEVMEFFEGLTAAKDESGLEGEKLERKRKPTEKDKETEKDKPYPGVITARMGSYFTKVKGIEQMLPKLKHDPEQVIRLLYYASRDMLPELDACYPPLKIEDESDDATFSRSRWVIEIPVPDDLDTRTATNLQKISTTVFHETRHLEQAWLEAVKRGKPRPGSRSQPINTIAQELGMSKETFEKLSKIQPPGEIDLSHMTPILKLKPNDRSQHGKRMTKMETLRPRASLPSEELALLGQVPLTKEEQGELDRLMTAYKTYPLEADAYKAEDVYEAYYKDNQ